MRFAAAADSAGPGRKELEEGGGADQPDIFHPDCSGWDRRGSTCPRGVKTVLRLRSSSSRKSSSYPMRMNAGIDAGPSA